MMSPGERTADNRWMVSSIGAPAGIINQKMRGALSFWPRSSRLPAPVAPLAASAAMASADRSKTTTWWPPCIRRTVMPAPIRPSPIIPNSIYASNARMALKRRSRRPAGRRADRLPDCHQTLRHITELYAKHAPPVVAQRLEITKGLRLLEDAKRELLARNRHIIRVVANHLEEDARVGAAFVQLPGRVQVARPIADRRCHPVFVADGEPDRVERAVMLRVGCDEGEQSHVVAAPNLAEQGLDRRVERRPCLAGPPDPLADRRRIALAQDFLGEVLRLLHVRLVEDVDAKDRARHRDRILPTEKLRPDGERVAELEGDKRMTGFAERRQGSRLSVTRQRPPDEKAITAIDLRRAERLIRDRHQALAFFAGTLRDQLLGPHAETLHRGGRDDRDLVPPDLCRLGEDGSQPGSRVLAHRDRRGTCLHHGRRSVEQAGKLHPTQPRRHEAKVRRGRVTAADVRRVEEGAAEPSPGGLLGQRRSRGG